MIEIWKACKDGDIYMMRVIIREGHNINQQTQNKGNPPIHIAAKNGHYLIVKLLFNSDADS